MSKNAKQNQAWMYSSVILALVLIIYMTMYPPGSKSNIEGGAVAKVNGVNISKDKLYAALVEAGGTQTLETLINNELVRQAAEEKEIKVSEEDIEKEMSTLKADFATEEEFESTLAMYGMTLSGLRNDMTTQVQLRKLFEPQVTVTDDEIQAYYTENLELLKTPEQIQTSHIVVDTQAQADAILTELKAGADFAATAREKSRDPLTKNNGGALEPISRGQLDEATENKLFALEVGGYSDVMEDSDGFHIYTLTGRQAAITPTLEEKKEEIRETLTADQITTLSTEWMTEQQSTAVIENYLS